MDNVIKNKFLKVDFDASISVLHLEWFADTEHMTADNYKENLTKLADFVVSNKVKRWLGDTLHFAYPISPELQEWTVENFNAKLLEGGLQRMALIIPQEFIANLAVQQTVDEMDSSNTEKSLLIRYFVTIEEAKEFLMEA